MSKKYLGLVGIAALGLVLSSCSAGGGQTTEEACAAVYEGMEQLDTELASAAGEGSEEDLTAMVTAANKSLDTLSAKITNKEVKEVWTPISDLQREGLQAAADQDEEALMAAYLDMADKYEAFVAVCPAEGSQSAQSNETEISQSEEAEVPQS